MHQAPLALADVRLGEHWSSRQRLKNALLFCLIQRALSVADAIPARQLERIGRWLGRSLHVLSRRMRAKTEANLAVAIPHRDPRELARRSFENAGENLALCLLLRRPSLRALNLVHVGDEARAALSVALKDSGAVVVSAHLGAFELVAAAVAELGMRPAVVVRQSYDPRLDPLVDAHRAHRGIEVIHRGTPQTARLMLRALRQRRPLGVLVDLPARVPSVQTRFMSGMASIAVGPQRLAVRTGSPLLIATLGPPKVAGYRFSLCVRGIERAENESFQALTQRVATALEGAILDLPEHWLWMGAHFRQSCGGPAAPSRLASRPAGERLAIY